MIGRGLILNPGMIHGGTKAQFQKFHERLVEGYLGRGLSETSVLFKMKELWFYQIHLFADTKKYEKQIRKVQNLSQYRQIVEELLQECDFCLQLPYALVGSVELIMQHVQVVGEVFRPIREAVPFFCFRVCVFHIPEV